MRRRPTPGPMTTRAPGRSPRANGRRSLAPHGGPARIALALVLLAVGSMALAGPISQASSLGVHAPPPAPPPARPPTPRAAVAGGPTAAALSAGPAPFHARSSNATLKPQWWDVTSESTTPFPVEEFTQGTWDGADDGVLFYGGDDYNVNLNGTWLYETGQWTEVTTLG